MDPATQSSLDPSMQCYGWKSFRHTTLKYKEQLQRAQGIHETYILGFNQLWIKTICRPVRQDAPSGTSITRGNQLLSRIWGLLYRREFMCRSGQKPMFQEIIGSNCEPTLAALLNEHVIKLPFKIFCLCTYVSAVFKPNQRNFLLHLAETHSWSKVLKISNYWVCSPKWEICINSTTVAQRMKYAEEKV